MPTTDRPHVSLLAARGFGPFVDVRGRLSVADMFPKTRRCGIYVLEFATGEVYAGQAIDVCRRYTQHRLNHSDVVAMTFLRTPQSLLNEVERELIFDLDRSRIPLRNFTFTSAPSGESDLDLVLAHEVQEVFVSGRQTYESLTQRPTSLELRRKYARRFDKLLRFKGTEEVIQALRSYVQHLLPSPRTTEISFWSSSCYPSSSVFSRINVNWQEVCTAFQEDVPMLSLHVARSPCEEAFGASLRSLSKQISGVRVVDHQYEPGGSDQVNLIFRVGKVAERVLSNPVVARAARLMNLRLMRKGACTFGRYHCPQLADRLLD